MRLVTGLFMITNCSANTLSTSKTSMQVVHTNLRPRVTKWDGNDGVCHFR